jgi:hypothetical protein
MMLRMMTLLAVTLSLAFADRLTLRDGRDVEGTYLGGDARQIRMAVGDKIESYRVSEIASLQFGGAAAATPASSGLGAGLGAATARPVETKPAAAAPASEKEIPAGTEVVIRMIDDVDSEVSRVGQTFKASLDEPVIVSGNTMIPRNVDVTVKLIEDQQSGKLTGRTELTLALVDVTVDGKQVPVVTQEVTQASESRTGRTAKVVGGTAALGAIIGAIAGGGKGAAVGATTGAGAGAAVQVLTKGQRVRIPSETRLTFTLKEPVRL